MEAFKLLWSGPGKSNVCVSSLHASFCYLKPKDWRGEKSSLRDGMKGRGQVGNGNSSTPKAGSSHQATTQTGYKAWQGDLRREKEVCLCGSGFGWVGVSICLWKHSHKVHSEHVSVVLHIVYLFDKQKQATHWTMHLLKCQKFNIAPFYQT